MNEKIFPLNVIILIYLLHMLLPAQDAKFTDSRGTPIPPLLLKKISVEYNNIPLLGALSDFSKHAKLYLNYNEKIIPTDHNVAIIKHNVPAITILQKLLEETDIEFIIYRSNQIVLARAQNPYTFKSKKYTISGYIIDAETGEALIGTNIYMEKQRTGCVSNVYGFYSLTAVAGRHSVIYSYMGYKAVKINVLLDQNIKKNIELTPSVIEGDTIVVSAMSEEDLLKTTELGTIKLSPSDLYRMPALFGEQDILKTLHLLPGVTLTREGDSGFHVRGGNSDQNLVLLDEAPVYNAYHFFGFFSVFNSDAIKNVKLFKGTAPANYGGSLSSVLDIKMKEGNYKKFHCYGGIGTIFSRLTVEGPIVKGKSSFIISGRRTYADVFTRMVSTDEVKNSTLYFYDFNLKANYRLSQKNRFFLSGYFGRDALGFSKIFKNTWGNETATLRWNHLFNHKLFLNSSLIFSNFKYAMNVEDEEESNADDSVKLENNINALTIKQDFQYFLNVRNTFNFGWQYVYYNFLPGRVSGGGQQSAFDLIGGRRKAHDGAVYLTHELEATERFRINYGLRYSQFSVDRLSDSYYFTDVEDLPDIAFRDEETVTYGGLEPRFSANYEWNKFSSIKFGYARNYQNIHVLSNSTPGTPLDVWQPTSSRVKPQRADQFSIGLFRKLNNNIYDLSAEVFYKSMKNQVDFENGANIYLSTLFESDIIFGSGRAYGVEFLLKKAKGKLTGWIGYSISRSERTFSDIDQGNPFPTKFDRTHDLSLVMVYKMNHKWTFAANWVYYTGNAMTIPYGKYQINGRIIKAYSKRNSFRMPVYHRFDVNITYTTKNGHFWNFSLYNAYGRKNAFALIFRNDDQIPLKLSLFTFVPSISYNFKF